MLLFLETTNIQKFCLNSLKKYNDFLQMCEKYFNIVVGYEYRNNKEN